MHNLRPLLLICLLFTSFIVPAAESPKVFDNQYKAKLYGFNITVTNRLTKTTNNQYDLLFKFDSMIGTITETSQMQWDQARQTIKPLHYAYKRRGLGKDRDADLTFDWNKKTVINKVQQTNWKMDIAQRVQDKLSYQIQLQQDLINGQTNFSYQIADGGHLKEYKFITLGEEVLETPLGKVNTIKVKRSRDNDKRVTYAWLAKDWNYLLVRLQQEEKGSKYTIYIHKASIDGKTIEKF